MGGRTRVCVVCACTRSGAVMEDFVFSATLHTGLDCEIDIQKSILSVRSQRSGMVQTEVRMYAPIV